MKKLSKYFKKSARSKIAVLGVVWLLVAAGGLGVLAVYENTPGLSTAAAAQFPAQSSLRRSPGRPTLVMTVHPKCPCSRASLGELELLMAQTGERAKTYVLFLKPPDFTEDWEKTDLWAKASAIPGVEVVQDTGGKEAVLFNAAISGQTFLYDAGGRLLFTGGITVSRGHAGDNAGRSAIVEILNEGKSEQNTSAVYGCPLFNRGEACPMPQ